MDNDKKQPIKKPPQSDAEKIEIYRKLWRHCTAVIHLIAELDLGYKIDLKG